jgi:hypothetical protein
MVADLEDQAMGDCTELMTKLDAILAAVSCICPSLLEMRAGTTLQPDSLNTDEITDVFEWSDSVPNPTIPSETETAACAISQLWYQAGFEVITEAVLPASRAAFDVLLALVAAKVAVMTGGLTLPQVLGAVTVADLVKELIEGGFDASESNIYNWMVTNKEDIVCALYEQVMAGGTATSCWAACYDSVIAPSAEISALDKAMLWLFMGHVAYVIAYLAYNESTDWATSVVVPGYCSVCSVCQSVTQFTAPPCPGDFTLGGGAVCHSGLLMPKLTQGDWCSCPSFAPNCAGSKTFQLEVRHYAEAPLNWDQATVNLYRKVNGEGDWINTRQVTYKANPSPGWNLWTDTPQGITLNAGDLFYIKVTGLQNSGPDMINYVKLTIADV